MESARVIAATSADNVYVGPRPFETGETLYGRACEAEELLSLLIAERVVLLYSPSGAGKTSLVQACLVPAMKEEGFLAAPVIRVGLRPPGAEADAGKRYRLSALLSLEEHRPEAGRRPASALAGLTLNDYLRDAFPAPADNEDAPRPLLLIFDQFEELLRLDPTDEAAKRAFVREVGEALRDRGRWALFVMREDFVAALDPYRPALPRQLTATYRLDLLASDAAAEAIRAPAEAAGVGDVSERLVRDWISQQLVTSQGVRRPVLSGEEKDFGLTPACLAVLDKAFLIRTEHRGGAMWYELAHDRLVKPVVQDNARWRRENLVAFPFQAATWQEQGRPDKLLLGGALLRDAYRWARDNPGRLTKSEVDCLKASQDKSNRAGVSTAVKFLAMLIVAGIAGMKYEARNNELDKNLPDVSKKKPTEGRPRPEQDKLLRGVIQSLIAEPRSGREAVESATESRLLDLNKVFNITKKGLRR